MATTKRSKAGRTKTTARGRAASSAKTSAKATAKKKSAPRAAAPKAKPAAVAAKAKPLAAKAKPVAKAKALPVAKAKASAKAKPSRAAAVENPEAAALKAKFQRERNGLEKRLTEAVREIGILRHHEARAIHFERQVGERDATIARLQAQLSELERRPSEPIYVREVQQSLALSAPTHVPDTVRADMDHSAADLDESVGDLDEFEDDRLADDGDLVSDDD